MDINSLLSPQDSAQSGTSTPAGPPLSPHKNLRRARSTSLRQGMTSSPLAHHVLAPAQLPEPSPPAVSPPSGPVGGGGTGTPPSSELQPTRGPSTPGMDTLADLASMQQHQPQRSNAPMLRNTESYGSQLSPSTMYPNVQPITHNTPTPRSSFDIAMSDAPREAARRNYTDTSLSSDSQRLATQLFLHIQETPHAYESHLKFIQLLHQGFVNHVYPPSDPETHGNPQKYDLLKDLRTAREQMDKLFAMGEDLWAEWIQDESMLAQTVEERIAVMELCQRSVDEEFGSTKLWVIFGDWMLYLYNSAFQSGGQWSEEDKLVGQEVFSWQSVLDVWKKGADATTWRINDSHLIWNRYLELVMQDLSSSPSPDKVSQVRALFDNRLQVPHANWDQTFELFSNFISTYSNAQYEEIMVETNAKSADGKAKHSARQEMEANLQRAIESGDRNEEWTAFAGYIEWEVNQSRKKRHFNFDLANALFQRAVLRFPTDAGFWEDYVMFSIDESMHGHTAVSAIPPLERGTRHCPWSGSLWSQHLLSSERQGCSFSHIADIKHKATSTGLLDAGGMEEVLKVHATWCSYLRRRAFQADSTDEDLDVAEVGIRSAIESVQELGEKKYGKLYEGDPVFRLERIYIRYLSESGSYDSARETFKGLISRRGNSYEFWMIYYSWELVSWSKFVRGDATADASRKTPNPSYATAVLKQALKRTDLDWPEKIMTAYLSHCEDYEDAEELQLAVVEVRKAAKAVARKREIAAQEAAAQQPQPEPQPEIQNHTSPTTKRKREEEADAGSANKKPRPEKSEPMVESGLSEPKRDRENSTIVVKNIPEDVTETKIRQYFRDCGPINSLKVLPAEGNSITALIEFGSREDAVAAQTRDQRLWNENTIEVQIGSGATLYVTNFPPTADETYIRDLFNSYGEIVDVRMPSLKYNTHRRFCYVQFRSPSSAYEATQLNDSLVGETLHLIVKISDPSKREARTGPVHEGREIHVSNIDWKATEDDLNELFLAYGKVESVRLPTKVGGGIKGFGFVVFASKDEANAALEMDQKDFRNRPLQVQISTPGGAKRQATNIISHVSRSKSPSVEANGGSTPTPSGSGADRATNDRHERSIGLMNIPDTVNDARIRSLVERYGPLVKIVLRPDHQGAIVEFVNAVDTGKASLGLEGREITPGRQIRVGTVPEMLRQAPERKGNQAQVGKKKEAAKSAMMAQPTGPVKRPQQPSGRGGRRGGLGMKRNGGFGTHNAPKKAEPNDASAASDGVEEKKAPKNNDDFRAMLQHKSS